MENKLQRQVYYGTLTSKAELIINNRLSLVDVEQGQHTTKWGRHDKEQGDIQTINTQEVTREEETGGSVVGTNHRNKTWESKAEN